jgi:hypothetical protein
MRRLTRGRRMAAAVAATALLLAACGDDAADDTPPPADQQPDDGDNGDEAETITVGAFDYGYTDLPGEIAAGTTIVMRNDSDAEVHEILAFRLPDDEDRPIQDLMQLSEEELMPLLDMRGVALAPPGADSTALPVPPLTLEQPGRYVFLCIIPTNAPPDEVMAAVQAFVESGEEEGAPDYPETGPPHFVNGMFAEVHVN